MINGSKKDTLSWIHISLRRFIYTFLWLLLYDTFREVLRELKMIRLCRPYFWARKGKNGRERAKTATPWKKGRERASMRVGRAGQGCGESFLRALALPALALHALALPTLALPVPAPPCPFSPCHALAPPIGIGGDRPGTFRGGDMKLKKWWKTGLFWTFKVCTLFSYLLDFTTYIIYIPMWVFIFILQKT